MNILSIVFKANQSDFFTTSLASWQQVDAFYWCKGQHKTRVNALCEPCYSTLFKKALTKASREENSVPFLCSFNVKM